MSPRLWLLPGKRLLERTCDARVLTTWKLTIEYDGSRYSGWQEQQNARTVAGQIRETAEDLLQDRVELQGSGRTDAGVHALAQVAHLRTQSKLTDGVRLCREMNRRLPADIVILEAEIAPQRFHSRHDAISRQYLYQISTRKTAYLKKYVWWIKEDLHLDAMAQAATLLIGRHDFVCFRAADPARPNESTIVVVESAGLEEDQHLILFRIEASHFIWRMVRRVVGVLVRVGTGDVSTEQFQSLLMGKCESKIDVAGWTAPAAGLFLEHVRYPEPRAHKRRS